MKNDRSVEEPNDKDLVVFNTSRGERPSKDTKRSTVTELQEHHSRQGEQALHIVPGRMFLRHWSETHFGSMGKVDSTQRCAALPPFKEALVELTADNTIVGVMDMKVLHHLNTKHKKLHIDFLVM
jgi:hypothetical protein